jgi:hypothetical protein
MYIKQIKLLLKYDKKTKKYLVTVKPFDHGIILKNSKNKSVILIINHINILGNKSFLNCYETDLFVKIKLRKINEVFYGDEFMYIPGLIRKNNIWSIDNNYKPKKMLENNNNDIKIIGNYFDIEILKDNDRIILTDDVEMFLEFNW